jgi:hypothetical protein
MAWATYQDVLDRWVGNDAPTDTDVITALITDAEAVITAHYPGIQARITSGDLNEDLVIMVVVRMVTRVLRNPGNLTYLQQTTGPFGQGRTFGNDRDVWLTDDEKTLLAPQSRGKAFEVNQGYTANLAAYDTVWIQVN